MIELNSKTQQDFLNREWVQKLLDAGVDMSDAKYCIVEKDNSGKYFIVIKGLEAARTPHYYFLCPTYTVSEILYKLHEYIYPTINGEEYSGGLRFLKDAPFYIWYYALMKKDSTKTKEDYIYAEAEYPIESLAMLLIQCHKKDIGIASKDTGDISGK